MRGGYSEEQGSYSREWAVTAEEWKSCPEAGRGFSEAEAAGSAERRSPAQAGMLAFEEKSGDQGEGAFDNFKTAEAAVLHF